MTDSLVLKLLSYSGSKFGKLNFGVKQVDGGQISTGEKLPLINLFDTKFKCFPSPPTQTTVSLVIIYTKKLLDSDWLRKEFSSSVTRVQKV